jgi:hypothetical protein
MQVAFLPHCSMEFCMASPIFEGDTIRIKLAQRTLSPLILIAICPKVYYTLNIENTGPGRGHIVLRLD